ncbi:ATPase family AAA domain-containing protein 3A homolog [Eumeta japonica]|uniref:ATPase family AAA domain-containing protein 3A homolog n=1 Tax=Eumeta variegata TaxID=151549 RepID=A0A4C2A925_EUMVA|nr:ATPase family AAA domain-containing protein 3A homolog [Eumeta japonica]
MKLKLAEERATVIESIKTIGNVTGTGFNILTRLESDIDISRVYKASFDTLKKFVANLKNPDALAGVRKRLLECPAEPFLSLVAWQAAAYASEDGRLTESMCLDICDDAIIDHRQKMRWLSEEEKLMMERQIQLQYQMQERQMAMQIAKIENFVFGSLRFM